MVFHCPRNDQLRGRYRGALFAAGGSAGGLAAWLRQDPVAVASFVHACAEISRTPASTEEPEPQDQARELTDNELADDD